MDHAELGVIALTVPLPRSEESKDGEIIQQEPMTTQNGEGFVMSRIEGVPRTDDESKNEGSSDYSKIRVVAQEWSPNQTADPNNPHCHRSVYVQSVNLNNRFYIF